MNGRPKMAELISSRCPLGCGFGWLQGSMYGVYICATSYTIEHMCGGDAAFYGRPICNRADHYIFAL